MAGSKVKFNIKNVHYAVLGDDGEYETPVAMPGAVSISLEQQGEITPFYADGIVYYRSASNGGYEGDLELAMVPDSFRTDVLGKYRCSRKDICPGISDRRRCGTDTVLVLQLYGNPSECGVADNRGYKRAWNGHTDNLMHIE